MYPALAGSAMWLFSVAISGSRPTILRIGGGSCLGIALASIGSAIWLWAVDVSAAREARSERRRLLLRSTAATAIVATTLATPAVDPMIAHIVSTSMGTA
ncbi:hypothetical protein Aau02nite_56880 [Amorphoplanes auranticolor]|uniref:Uncharacterized protein n=1 Tax=Actinoplanes auranticolor TaxID=47988 RepID=A0A919SK94_9ACTN|nr:hypothetical protein Aau02nite_56880 [Actinoplanes auranticolor]